MADHIFEMTLCIEGRRRLTYAAVAIGILPFSDDHKRRLLNRLLWLLRVRWVINGIDQGILQLP